MRDSTGDSLLSCIGNSYRTYDEQVELYGQKPGLAAEPGTSKHGWGLAIDFECGANSYSSSFYAWLDANGPGYGWTNPPWAQPGGSRPEPWHGRPRCGQRRILHPWDCSSRHAHLTRRGATSCGPARASMSLR